MGRVSNKIALVTGGAMGIGQACAEALAREGATVVISDIDKTEGTQTVEAIKATGGDARFVEQDVTDEAQWIDLMNTLKASGGLHILVNNAGIAIAAALTEMSLKDFRQQNAVNLDGVFLGLKHGIPLIHQSGGGSIINLSSVAGLKASPGLSAYAMTKGGVRLLSKSAALECAREGLKVRVNSVHPGVIKTAIWDKIVPNNKDGINRLDPEDIATNSVPGGLLGEPSDIANGVLYLASDEARYVTGSELVIDHGISA